MWTQTRTVAALIGVLALVAAGCAAGGSTEQNGGGGGAVGPDIAALSQPGGGSAPALAEGITVIGTGRISGEPDTLRTTVGVEVERETVDAALTAANEAAQRVIDAVTAAGVAEQDIQTREFDVSARYDHPRDGEPVLRGYAVRNLVEVKVRDLDRAGDVLTAATEAGGDDARVHGVRFALEDNEAMLEAARERAFQDARARAEQYATLAGRELGTLVSVSEHLTAPPPVHEFDQRAMEEAAPAPGGAVPVQPGQQEVEVKVTAIWSMN